jgi:hypothetical protein
MRLVHLSYIHLLEFSSQVHLTGTGDVTLESVEGHTTANLSS